MAKHKQNWSLYIIINIKVSIKVIKDLFVYFSDWFSNLG